MALKLRAKIADFLLRQTAVRNPVQRQQYAEAKRHAAAESASLWNLSIDRKAKRKPSFAGMSKEELRRLFCDVRHRTRVVVRLDLDPIPELQRSSQAIEAGAKIRR